MTGLRRRAPLIGMLAAWLFAFATLAGGLALARTLPEAHAAALAHSGPCLTGEAGEPPGHAGGHAPGCQSCPAPVQAFAAPGAPTAAAAVATPFRDSAASGFVVAAAPAIASACMRDGEARGPPRV